MGVFEVYLDIAGSGRVMAHLLEPPGLGMRFESRAGMKHRLPEEIRRHLDWLASHGERIPDDPPHAFRIVAELPMAGDFESGDDVGFYAPDAVPVTPAEVERYLRIAGHAHRDLLGLVEPLDDAALDWVRDERTRSIRRVIRHVVGAELWYMGRIIDDPDRRPVPEVVQRAFDRVEATADMVERLRIAWPAFRQWARSLSPELRARVTEPTWWTYRAGEQWTARKMLRRCVEHCREHACSVERILTDYRARAS